MPSPSSEREAVTRPLIFIRNPRLWPAYPVLPVVRQRPGREPELGVLYDLLGTAALPGYSATVFLVNLFHFPPSLDEFLALPREVFDTTDELVAAGWRVD